MKSSFFLALIFMFSGLFAQNLQVSMIPWGPTPGDIDKLIVPIEGNLKLRGLLGNSYRQLDLRLIDENVKGAPAIMPPSIYEAVYYNYATNKAFVVTGELDEPLNMKIRFLSEQPPASQAEYDAAVSILAKDPKYGPAYLKGEIVPFQPLPPATRGPNNERLVVVGIRSHISAIKEGLVGVNMGLQQVFGPLNNLNYAGNSALSSVCDVPDAEGCWNPIGVGAVQVVITDSTDTLWTFHALRPGSSSGNLQTHSGIEVRYVRYKGRMVMWRGHMPILNVQYKNNFCGPYRDWMHEESCFDAVGTEVPGTGFIKCTSKPETILEHPDSDDGNFTGVAVYADTAKVTLISELEAGWYRYITEWRFFENGEIEPILGFGATYNGCTCNEHYHHGYWRFDMDVDAHDNNTVQQLKDSSGTWVNVKTVSPEEKQYRDTTITYKWRVKRSNDVYYDIITGPNDGTALGDAFAKGDIWSLRYHTNEIDDNVTCIYGGGCLNGDVTANISQFVNNEAIVNKDVVVWYGAHKKHFADDEDGGAERRGPRLVPSPNFTTGSLAHAAPPSSETIDASENNNTAGLKRGPADKGPQLELFPNPTSNSFDLRLSAMDDRQVQVRIVDLNGKTVFEGNPASSGNEMQMNILSGSWPNGTYIVEVSTPGWIITKKLVKHGR